MPCGRRVGAACRTVSRTPRSKRLCEDAPATFALAARAVEMGYDLRLVCRELARVVRDLLVLSVDPSRAADPEIAGQDERDRLLARRALAGPPDHPRSDRAPRASVG